MSDSSSNTRNGSNEVPRVRSGPRGIVSYAQNAEDVRLWRVFKDQPHGFYVDVGANDPELDSVTKLFYDAGWSGLNIEPGPSYEALVVARGRDVNLEVAVTTEEGEADFWVSSPGSGLSGFERPPEDLVPAGFSFTRKRVRCARLDVLIAEHAPGREIDFLKIDVEGAERDVLASFDPTVIRPTIVVVESISPLESRQNHQEWEPLLLDGRYVFAAFDGINRFYVAEEHHELVDTLGYPMSALDRYESVHEHEALEAKTRVARLNALHKTRVHELELENRRLAERDVDALAQLEAIQHTVSWRITRPLRAARRAQRRRAAAASARARDARGTTARTPDGAASDLERAFADRIVEAVTLLDPDVTPPREAGLDEAMALFETTLSLSPVPDRAKAWLSLVATEGSFPEERGVARLARRLRMEGADAVVAELGSRFEDACRRGAAPAGGLDVRRNRLVVDVTHTVSLSLHTGIQRVVRETVSRWLDEGLPVDLAHFDFRTGALHLLAPSEYERLRRWPEHLGESGDKISARFPEHASDAILVPWGCRFFVPEFTPEPGRCAVYRTLAASSVLGELAVLGYDLIPIVAPEHVAAGLTESFGGYLSVVKHADRISAISETSAAAFRDFGEMVEPEGIRKPDVQAHSLPAEAVQLAPETIEAARSTLGLDRRPVILAVGSFEPRKNHLGILEAAERLWRRGDDFQLLFIGGGGWKREEFDELVEWLVEAGRPIVTRMRSTEVELWAAYRIARFTVFPSFLEGFGLPVAESLASGTPAITSARGSMAEVAERGGCLLVDPGDVDSIEGAMSRLLHDDDLLERLARDATRRPTRTWADYADELWRFLTADER